MSQKVHDAMTAKRRRTIELARIRRHKRLLPPIAPPPGTGGTGTGTILGSGTAGHVAKWIAVDTLGDSLIRDDGATVTLVRTTAAVDIFRIMDTDGSFMLDVDKDGLLGINCDPDGMVTIQGGGLQAPVTSSLLGWYRADSITTGQVVGGVLSTGALVSAWTDSSGNGNHLTGRGSTLADVDTPSFRPQYNVAGSGKAITALPSVSFEGNTAGSGKASYFTIDTAPFQFPEANGYTIAMIWRDHSNAITNPSVFFGASQPAGDDTDDFIREDLAAATNDAFWIIGQGGGVKNFSILFSHTKGNDTEAVVLRVTAGTGVASNTLRCWIDGVLKTPVGGDVRGDDPPAFLPYVLRYIGRHLNSVGNVSTTYGKALVELQIFNRELTDAEVALVNTYLLNRIAGASSAVSYDLTRWKNTGGTLKGRVDPEGNLVLPLATSANTGVVFRDLTNSYPWMHDFTNPTGFTDANVDTLANARCIFLGFGAGNFTLSGTSTQGKANVGIGHYALHNLTTGPQNVAIGRQALRLCTAGGYNMGIGAGALGALTSGSSNAGIGTAALGSLASSDNNVGIGDSCGLTIVAGTQNTLIGALADATGDFSNVIGIGYDVKVDASNKTVIGNTSTTVTELRGDLSIWNLADTFKATFDTSLLTANRTFTFPNGGGTFVLGGGTVNQLPKFTSAFALGNSLFSDDGTNPAFKSAGSPQALFDTSLLAISNGSDKTLFLWETDPSIGFGAVVTGYSQAGGSNTPGTLAVWSGDPNYSASLQGSGLTFDRTYFDVPDLNGVDAVVRIGSTSGNRVEIRANNGGGVNRIDAFGAGARFEMAGNTTADLLKVAGTISTVGGGSSVGNIKSGAGLFGLWTAESLSSSRNIVTASRFAIAITNASGTNTFTLDAPSQGDSQMLILICKVLTSGTMTLADSGSVDLSAAWVPDAGDTLTLFGSEGKWYEQSRSAN